jgi:hypothetical protein
MSKSSPDLSLHTGAAGGPGLGRTRDFLKANEAVDQDYGKSGSSTPQNKRTGDKSLKVIKPRC